MADRVVSYDFRGNFTSLTAGLAAASKGVQDLGGKLTALDKNGAKMRAGLDTLGGAAGKLGLVAAAGLGAAVLASANFDQAMSKVQAATGESAAAMEQLREAALKAGADTAFSATEAAAGVENLAKAGVSTADILGGGLTGALDLAAAGELDVASAAEIAATAMTQFKLSGEDVPHIADLLAAGAGKAQGEVTDLAAALNQSGLVAGQMGLSIEETTGALAAFASAGLLGSDAGTSLKTMLLRLANPSQEAADTMADLGINAYDASGNLVSMSELAGQLEGAFEGMTQKQRDAALATIFGSDAIRAANVLYSQGADGIQAWTNNVDDAGYAAETAATKMDNLKGDLEAFMGSLETALIGTGDGAQGPLRSLVQGATAAVNAFNDLPGPIKSVTAGMLGITAVLGGGLWFTSKVINGIASAKTALGQLGISASTTTTSLQRMTRTTGGLLAMGAAVTILGNELAKATGSKLDTADLQRNLEALADGRGADLMKTFAEDLGTVGQTAGKIVEPLKEAVTAFGLFGNTPMDNSKENIEAIDQALASMVESGDAAGAAAMFAELESGAVAAGRSTEEVRNALDSYFLALENAEAATDGTTAATEGAATATSGYAAAAKAAADAAKDEAAALRDSIKAMQAKRDAALAAFDAETAWRQALKAAADQARKNSAGIRGNTDAALENRNALSNLAGAWNGLSNQAQNMPGRFQAARKSFIDTATAMGVPRKQAVALARELLEIPTKVVTTTRVETGNSHAEIQGVFDHLTRLDGKTATTYIHTVRTGGEGDFVSGGKARATGGYVSGPGTATSDSIPARLSNGEYVVKASAVAQYGVGFLDAVNAQRFASGGLAGTAKQTDIRGTYGLARVAAAAGAAAEAMSDVADASGKELRARQKELEHRQKMLTEELDAHKQRLEALKQERKALKDAVAGLISGGDLFTVNGPRDTSGMSEDMQATLALHQENVGSVTSNIDSMIEAGQERLRLLRILKRMGLSGPALAYIATQPIEVLRELASGSRSTVREFEQQYGQLQGIAQQAGTFAGNAVFGKSIDRVADRVAETNQELKKITQRLNKLEDVKQATEKGADRVVGAIKGTTGDAARRHR